MDVGDTLFQKATTAVVGLTAITIVYSIFMAIYNLYFHPLAKFPGPRLNAAWDWPYFKALLAGTHDHGLKDLHAQYGEVVRYRPNRLSFTSSGAWKDIYGSGAGKKQLQKDPDFYTITGDEPTSIIWSSDADHSRMRKLLAHAFSDAALRQQETILTHYFELMVTGLKKKAEDPTVKSVDMTRWYNFVTFDIIGDLAFGESFGALESGEYHIWMQNLFQGVKSARILKTAQFYKPLMSILQGLIKLSPAITKAREEHMKFSEVKTEKRLAAKTDRQDFMTYILRHNDERGMTHSEIISTAEILIIGGSETTSTLLTGVTYYLLKNPEIYAKVKKEVRDAFQSGDDLTLQSTARLPYLQAVLEEGLRMYPPVPLGSARLTPPEGCLINGNFIPGNASVSIHHLSTYYSEKNFFEPEKFVPERWLPDVPAAYEKDDRACFNPFSAGPRGCIGKNLAWNEMRSILARMLFHFDMELCDDSQEWNKHLIFMMWEKPELNIKLSLRKS
ncbi:cytochrome p450 [Phlyctema vagabunda]|uniref:Cytochrome p450 n=1 Tax=Phlyctema vagabunda TaxID=108571 RepID=A0ABR4P2R2_9HELO